MSSSIDKIETLKQYIMHRVQSGVNFTKPPQSRSTGAFTDPELQAVYAGLAEVMLYAHPKLHSQLINEYKRVSTGDDEDYQNRFRFLLNGWSAVVDLINLHHTVNVRQR